MLRYHSRDHRYKKPFGAVAAETAIAFLVESDLETKRCKMYVRRESCSKGEEDLQWLVIGVDQGIEKDEKGTKVRKWAFSFTPEREGLYFYHFFGEQDAEDHTGARSILEQTPDHQLTVYKADYKTPDWLKHGLMYQIFPDRFCRSSEYTAPEIKNKKYWIHDSWGELPVKGPDENGIVWNNDFFGGNLKGIVEKLPYLEELGVTVIYLNPIFEAFSNHRYDTANYMKIDPMLGEDEDLRTLCEEAKKRGMRVILDGVFNHTGSHSIYFNQDGAYDTVGAAQSKDSPYYKWYQFKDYPEDYESWWGIKTLPNVNEDEPTYLDYILRNKDSVVKHWLSYGISGYRLDVADELPDVFLDEIRTQVKSVDPDACVLGEVWEDASNKIAYEQRRRYFHGDQLDSVMNYPLKDELIAFLLKHGDGQHFMNEICSLWENYPPQNFYALMNLLGTHDTVRIYTVMLNGSNNDRELGRQRLLLALPVWLFMPGIPCIYYGDELGMEGERDPMNRQCFPKKAEDVDVAQFYRRLLNFHKRTMGKDVMEFRPGDCGDGYISFFREGDDNMIYVYINASPEPKTIRFPMKPGHRLLDFVNSGSVTLDEDFGGCTLAGISGIVISTGV